MIDQRSDVRFREHAARRAHEMGAPSLWRHLWSGSLLGSVDVGCRTRSENVYRAITQRELPAQQHERAVALGFDFPSPHLQPNTH